VCSFYPKLFLLNLRSALDHFVDQAILLGIGSTKEVVSISILFDLLDSAAGVMMQDVVHAAFEIDDLIGLDLDIRCSALRTAPGLMDHDAAIWQSSSFARRSCRE